MATIEIESLQVGVKTAAKLLGISKSFLYELTAKSDFPLKPIKLGSKVLFNKKRLIEFVELGCPRTREKFEQLKRGSHE